MEGLSCFLIVRKVLVFMKIFVCFFILLIFSFYTFSIEINNDLFIEADNSEDDSVESNEMIGEYEVEEPNIKRVYKKETVVIKRDIASLDHIVDDLDKDERLSAKASKMDMVSDDNKLIKREITAEKYLYEQKHSSQSIDYGDYEIHWSKKD